MTTTSRRLPRDAGVSVVELLVAIIVVGILAAIAIPALRDQRMDQLDRVVVADLERYAAGAERAYSTNLRYPTTPAGFSLSDSDTPAMGGAGNRYRAFVVPSGARAGWVIYGRSSTTGNTYVLSSYDDGQPTLVGTTTIPLYPPTAGTHGVPSTIRASDWSTPGGVAWGDASVTVPTEATSPVMAWTDPAYANTTKAALTSAPLPQVGAHHDAPFRIVDTTSPVADRAIEVVTDSTTADQGVVLMRAPSSASLPGDVAAAGEQWTVSAFVKAPAGVTYAIGCRYLSPAGADVEQDSVVFTGDGAWQRPTHTCAATSSAVIGSRVNVQVYTQAKVPGTTFYVTGPQVNKGASATEFKRQ